MDEYTQTERAAYGRRSGRKAHASAKLLIEGESLTIPEIAQRLGIKESIVYNRYRRECGKPGPVTLAGLSS